jgi:hypothetical protein
MRFENRYSRLDRALHRVAFTALAAQESLADVEDHLYRERLGSVEPARPVMISGLPRSGTTILLNLLASTGRFATHTYRDMPFLLCPLLWQRLSRPFKVEDEARERAHADGLQISLDSPEAFEEVIWKRFWPGHYRKLWIEPWSPGETDPDFDAFLLRHMRKVIARRADRPGSGLRYLSKNNATISRLAALPGPMREGVVLIPFRDPLQHASSLLTQHRRFLEVHREDRFARRYMADIGHHEFGLEHRPINFSGWLEGAPGAETLEYWLLYWTAAYRHVLDSLGERTMLVSYRRLTEAPEPVLSSIGERIGADGEELAGRAGQVRAPRDHEITDRVDPSTLDAALEVYESLDRACRGLLSRAGRR